MFSNKEDGGGEENTRSKSETKSKFSKRQEAKGNG